jgi:hypothetical protein
VRFQAIEILVNLDAALETLVIELDPPPALRAASPARGGEANKPRLRHGALSLLPTRPVNQESWRPE